MKEFRRRREQRRWAALILNMLPRTVVPLLQKMGRGLDSFTLQLNLSALVGIGGARGDCVARVNGVLGGVEIV